MHPKNAGYRRGDNWATCAVCGIEYRASDFRRRWDGLMVCREDWEPQHPQEFVRGKRDDQRPSVTSGPRDVFELMPQVPDCPVITSPVDGAYTAEATTLDIAWLASSRADYYEVRVYPLHDPMPIIPLTTTGLTYSIDGLTPGIAYQVRVNAVNVNGRSSTAIATTGQGIPGCSAHGVTTIDLPCPGLLVPTNGSSVGSETSTTLLWEEVPGASVYRVYVWENGDPQPSTPTTVTAALTYEVTGLDQGVTYRWTIIAVTAQGFVSPGCSSSTFTTNAADAIIEWLSATFSGDLLSPSVTLTAIRSGNTTVEATADYDFTEGSALIGPDFVGAPGTVTFAPGEVTKDVVVPLVRDYDAEVLENEVAENLWSYIKFDETSGVTFDDKGASDRDYTLLGQSPITATYNRDPLNLASMRGMQKGTTGLDWYIRRSYNGSNMPQDQNVSFHGWGKFTTTNGTTDRCFCHIGGHAGAGQITKFQLYRRGSDGKLVCFWNAFNGVSTPSVFIVFDTPCPALGDEFWWSVAQDCDNSEVKLKINDSVIETKSWNPLTENPYQVVGRQTFITINSSFASVWDHNPIGGDYSQTEFRLDAEIRDRWPRWNLDASLSFLATLSNPGPDVTIGAVDETTMTMEAA